VCTYSIKTSKNAKFDRFINLVFNTKLPTAKLKAGEREFLQFTFDTIQTNETNKVASVLLLAEKT
jgi:hypothetical protein